MKRLLITVWADTVFLFFAAFLLFFCIFHYYLAGLVPALFAALAAAAAFAVLCHRLLMRRRQKKYGIAAGREEVQKLALHLALEPPAQSAARVAAALTADGTEARVCGDGIYTEEREYRPLFRLEPVTADEIKPFLRPQPPTLIAFSFTKDAEALADAFSLPRMDAEALYALLRRTGTLPQEYIAGKAKKRGLKDALRLRLRRASARGYLLSGAGLLLFSTVTVFPAYYVAAGALLLAVAVLVRLFGKT